MWNFRGVKKSGTESLDFQYFAKISKFTLKNEEKNFKTDMVFFIIPHKFKKRGILEVTSRSPLIQAKSLNITK